MDNLKPKLANSTPLTPLTFLERTALVHGDCPSIVYNNSTYTWSQTYHRCLQAASAISALGIRRADVVSVVAPNIPAMYELQFAVPMAGAILNSINTRLNASSISVIIHHSEAKLFFVHHQYRSLVLEALSLLPSTHPRPIVIIISNDDHKGSILHQDQSYERLIQNGDPNFAWVKPETEWDPITLNYTSGTTSSPKGVIHSHRAAFIAALSILNDWCVPQQPVYLWTLPMFHANGWSLTWAMCCVGAVNICTHRFSGPTIYSTIIHHRVTHMCAAPVVIEMLTNAVPRSNKLFDWPIHILTGGAPPPARLLGRAESLGLIIGHVYGLTETLAPTISCAWKPKWNKLPLDARARLKARQGVRTMALMEVNVVDLETREPVPKDGKTIGEVVLKGGSLMLGYLKDPQGTSKCMGEDGWFRTGDLGVIHQDGYLEIKDRSKDIIISGGENISSLEVETVLYNFPAVKEVAVVAKPDEYWGETPCAFVSLSEGVDVKPTEKDVIEYCRDKLAHYMVPKKVVFMDELPRTSTGKIQKSLLREMARDMIMVPLKSSRM